MKKPLSIALLVSLFTITGCGLKEIVGPNAVTENHTNSDSYQPVTAGSTWKYNVTAFGITDVKTTVMKGTTTVIDGRTFNVATDTQQSDGSTSNAYYYHNGNAYTYREDPSSPDDVIELQYLDDNAIIGSTFISKPNSTGTSNGVPVRWVGTIVDKNATRTVNSLAFKNVIHTKIELQYNYGSGFVSSGTVYDYYVSKGVGVIEVQLSGTGTPPATSTITSYNIK